MFSYSPFSQFCMLHTLFRCITYDVQHKIQRNTCHCINMKYFHFSRLVNAICMCKMCKSCRQNISFSVVRDSGIHIWRGGVWSGYRSHTIPLLCNSTSCSHTCASVAKLYILVVHWPNDGDALTVPGKNTASLAEINSILQPGKQPRHYHLWAYY